ncbi:MAG: lytic murein transglycosylase, partial [Patescibacteria group bacterium]
MNFFTLLNSLKSAVKTLKNSLGFFLLAAGMIVLFASMAGFFFIDSVSATVEDLKNDLKSKLETLQKQMADLDSHLRDTASQKKSLTNEISVLDGKIAKTKLGIREKELLLAQIITEIQEKNDLISGAERKIFGRKITLSNFLQKIYEYDEKSTLEIILENEQFSDFFGEINALETLHLEIQEILDKLKEEKSGFEKEKADLEDKKKEEAEIKSLSEFQKRFLENEETKKKRLLKTTKGKESEFQKIIKKTAKDITSIRNQLYQLEGVGVSMSFEKAYGLAKDVSSKTGIRPAFLLALLKVESRWGGNLGTGNWRVDMKPCQNDDGTYCGQQGAFLDICEKLGLNPDTTPVSKKPWYGWGGAMGAAQFMPMTWLLYENKVAALTGNNPPSPWAAKDAFAASAIKLSGDGASAKNYNAEWKAAMIYLAGGNWAKSAYRF